MINMHVFILWIELVKYFEYTCIDPYVLILTEYIIDYFKVDIFSWNKR